LKKDKSIKIIIEIKKILKENPNYTGEIQLSFCLGGLTGIKKIEKVKIK